MNRQTNNSADQINKIKKVTRFFYGSRKRKKLIRFLLTGSAILILWLIGQAIDLLFGLIYYLFSLLF